MEFTDNEAFSGVNGGAYHCWIESCPQDEDDRELVDISFKHNSAFAKSHKIVWRKKPSGYLWGTFSDLVIDTEINDLPPIFPEGKVWYRETPEGLEWMNKHVVSHMDQYVKITAFVLNKLKMTSVK